MSALLVAACASAPVARVDVDAVSRYRDAGYAVTSQSSIETHRISGAASETPWTASITRPGDGRPHGVIVYLPSLGQTDDAPNRWVSTWARAGYAVIAIQALADDAQVWATEEARSGDFERAARARFQPDLMTPRLARLSLILGQIRDRSLHGEPGFDALVWSELALAGADLGAYCVQSVAAAPAATLAAISWPLAPRAFVAISPYAVRNGPTPQRVADSRVPLLMISARDDIDADGVVTDTSLRRLAFDRLGRAGDYYFELGSATHRWLGGVVLPPGGAEPPVRRPPPSFADSSRKGKRGSAAATRDTMAPGGDEDDVLQEKSAQTAAVRAEMEKARGRAMTQEALGEVSFTAISTAFFDAYVRGLPTAQSWLADAAGKWLQDDDRLKRR